MAVKTIAFMLPWVDPLSANSNLYNAGLIARIETSIADRAITAGKALEINANIFDQQLNTTDSPTFAGLTVDTDTLFVDAANNRVGIGTASPATRAHVVSSSADIATFEAPVTGGQIRLYRGTSFGWDVGITGSSSFFIGPDGGSSALTILSGGNVGIGTTSPDYTLDVAGTTYATNFRGPDAGYTIGGDADNLGAAWQLYPTAGQIRGYIDGAEAVRLTSTGLGIGATAPATKLHVRDDSATPFTVQREAAGQFIDLDGNGYNGHHTLDGVAYFIGHNSGSRGFGLQTASTTRLFIQGGGNVGIGTTSPDHVLSVFQDNNGARTEIGIDNTDQRLVFGAFFQSGVAQYSTIQSTNNAETTAQALALQPDGGNVGIGTASPSDTLHVEGNVYLGTSARTIYAGGSANLSLQTGTGNVNILTANGATTIATFTNSGDVGIGTTAPAAKLQVIETGGVVAKFTRSDNGQILELDGSGYSGHHTLDGTAYLIGHNSGSRGLGLQTNSITRLYVTGAGDIGANTTSPAFKFDVSETISTKWQFGSARPTAVAASGGVMSIATGSGLLIVNCNDTGETAVFAVGGAGFVKLGGSSTANEMVASNTPAVGQIGIGWSGTNYQIVNNVAATRNIHVTGVAARSFN